MSTTTLNLARKWRSKQFKDIVGQDLSVRILKNSLYKNSLFPVYLFAGQHGCGKTSTARVFATALNCGQLAAFQKEPKNTTIPCLECSSCQAMLNNRHPDFIEIDAASHTGVDNVRQIVDASSLLPVMGSKKIYLIDEAHMLSKAAFNAFLKILEDPPDSVLFILATTHPEKIIETIKSRCFQLIFTSIETDALVKHLEFICGQESIHYEKEALGLIVKESAGSARDALNLLEQVRFSTSLLNRQAVSDLLGHLDDQTMQALFNIVTRGTVQELLAFFQEQRVAHYSADFIWRRLVDLVRSALRVKFGITTAQERPEFVSSVKTCSVEQLTDMLELFYSNELLFSKTTAQHALLEMILLQIIQKRIKTDDPAGSVPQTTTTAAPAEQEDDLEDDEEDEDHDDEEDEEEEEEFKRVWNAFVKQVNTLEEPLLSSIFHQAVPTAYDPVTKKLQISFAAQHKFFKELLDQMSDLWKPLVHKVTGTTADLDLKFVKQANNTKPHTTVPAALFAQRQNRSTEQSPDFTDATKWPKTKLVLDYFPGTVREIQGA